MFRTLTRARRPVVVALILIAFFYPLVSSLLATTTSSLPLGYHTADQISATLTQIAAQYPAIATVQALGPTWATTAGQANRQIWALRLCDACAGTMKLSAVFIGGQHAREISTSEVMLDLANDLASRFGSDPDVTYLLETSVVWIVPLANPDGHVQVESGLANWRKNVDSSYNLPGDASLTLPDGIGVDPNRNFGFHWGEGGASATPGAYNYQGPAAASEPETQALQIFLTAQHPTVLVDVHNPFAMVIWPWGYQSAPTADAATLSDAGHRLAEGPGYVTGQTYATVGFTTGDTLDWSYGTLGTIALGVELDGGFAPDIATVGSIWTKNRTGFLDAIRWTLDPTRARGPAIDSLNAALRCGAVGAPVTLQVTLSTTHAGSNPIAVAHYAIDNPDPIGSGQPMSVALGSSPGTATATATLPATLGRHVVYVAGQDSLDQWGDVVATSYLSEPNCVFLPQVSE